MTILLAKEVRRVIEEAASKIFHEAILFSGGLDSSIVACLNSKATCITVSLGRRAEDLGYADYLAKKIPLRQIHRFVDEDEAIESIPEVIRILKSFDPALPNDLAAYFGIEKAKQLGLRSIATGDGSDELFGGYSFMAGLGNLDGYIRRVARNMVFSSNGIGKALGLKIVQPFLDPMVRQAALKIPARFKVKRDIRGKWGKWILRKAFEGILPKRIAWQTKRPLEVGSGMTRLRKILEKRVPDHKFRNHSYPVKFFNKEHFYYYQIYRKAVGEIPRPKDNQKSCPGCGAGVDRQHFHCKICGYVFPFLNRYKRKGAQR